MRLLVLVPFLFSYFVCSVCNREIKGNAVFTEYGSHSVFNHLLNINDKTKANIANFHLKYTHLRLKASFCLWSDNTLDIFSIGSGCRIPKMVPEMSEANPWP